MIDKKNYQAFADAHAPKSKIWKNLLFAFLIGGAICTVGQGVLSFWKSAGLDTEAAGSATSASMVFLGALFTGHGSVIGCAAACLVVAGFFYLLLRRERKDDVPSEKRENAAV